MESKKIQESVTEKLKLAENGVHVEFSKEEEKFISSFEFVETALTLDEVVESREVKNG